MENIHKERPADIAAITHEDLLALDEIRSKCVESSALITAAAEMASPLATTPAIERLQALVQVAERSAESTLASIESLVAKLDKRRKGPTCDA